MRNKNLFEDDGSGDDTTVNEIKINAEFARRFEHNKKREELQRYEELKKKGAISESDECSSSESEEEEFRKKEDVEFFDVLLKVKNQDPILKNKETKLFKSDSESETEDENLDINGGKVKEKRKKMYLKDVIAKQLIEEGPEFEENDDGDDVVRNKVKSYDEEQEELKRAFLDAVNEEEKGEDGDELLRVKSKGGGKEKDDDEEDLEMARKIDELFGVNEKLDEDMIFLKDYFRNRMWVGEGADKGGEVDEEEDEEEIERQEDYERDYNFRFEENAGNRVMGHARIVEGSVRKTDNKRKEQRERKNMRNEKLKFEMKEELKHLKNLKKKEMHEKIKKIREVAGFGEDGDCLLDVSDLEEEFDPEAYDKKMREAFDEEYYEAEDIDPEFGNDSDEDGGDIQKPDFDKEDELLGLPNDWDQVYKSGGGLDPDSKEKFDKEDDLLGLTNGGDEMNKSDGGFRAARQKVLKLMAENGVNSDLAAEENLEEEAAQQKKKMKKEVSEAVKEVIDKCMDEYHRLEYEDTVGDLKTRFKYRPVKPKRFGLSDKEMLVADNKVLNQLVPLNKLAPYREKEWKVPRMKALQVKQQIREIRRKELSDVPKAGNKFGGTGVKQKSFANHENTEGPQPEDMNGGTSNQSRRAKRRRVQVGIKLSHERLLAYGKIPSKPKSRKKSLSSV